jgi:hypothetical protein
MKMLYPNHRPPLGSPKTLPRDRSNRWLGVTRIGGCIFVAPASQFGTQCVSRYFRCINNRSVSACVGSKKTYGFNWAKSVADVETLVGRPRKQARREARGPDKPISCESEARHSAEELCGEISCCEHKNTGPDKAHLVRNFVICMRLLETNQRK